MRLGRMIGLGLTAYTMYKAYQRYSHGGPATAPSRMAPGMPSAGASRATGLRREAMRRRGAL